MRIPRVVLHAFVPVAILCAGAAVSSAADLAKDKVAAVPEGTKVVAAKLGKPETAKWTATTYEAATAAANKEVLERGEVETVTGEVIDVSCYLQLGKRGEAHVACGSKCIQSGQPIGLLDEEGDVYILFAEEHHPRRDGWTDLKQVFLPLLAKNVTVTGMHTVMKGYHALFVSAEEIGAMAKPIEAKKEEKK